MRRLGILVLAGLASCTPKPALPDPARARAAREERIADEGRAVFARRCAPCHGEGGQGDGRYFASSLPVRPPDLTGAGFLEDRTDADLLRAIRGGSASLGRSALCPPWGATLDEEALGALVIHLRRLGRKEKSW